MDNNIQSDNQNFTAGSTGTMPEAASIEAIPLETIKVISLGEIIRNAREEKYISLSEVSAVTKINLPILSALENNQWEKLPARPFVRGYVLSICKHISLNPKTTLLQFDKQYDEYLNKNKDTISTFAIPAANNELNSDGQSKNGQQNNSSAAMAPEAGPITELKIVFFVILTILLVGSVLMYRYQEYFKLSFDKMGTPIDQVSTQSTVVVVSGANSNEVKNEEVKKVETSGVLEAHPQATAPLAEAIVPVANKVAASPTPVAATTSTTPNIERAVVPTTQPHKAEAHTATVNSAVNGVAGTNQILHLKATQNTWVKIALDGHPALDFTLTTGQSKEFSYTQKVEFLVANAGGLEAKLNGQPLKALGPVNKVATIKLPEQLKLYKP